jgi:hypothetical protein
MLILNKGSLFQPPTRVRLPLANPSILNAVFGNPILPEAFFAKKK